LIDDGKIIAQDNLDKLLKDHKQDSLEQMFLELTGKDIRNDV
jgi:ABC-2 type transport system ATP-binding protein